MRGWSRAHGVALGMTGMACACLVGCFGAYVLPTLSLTPSVRLPPTAEEVYAVRVDVADDENGDEVADHDRYFLHGVPFTLEGTLPPQLKLDLDYGWVWNSVVQSYRVRKHHTLMVRLYRPGWQTVEVRSWQLRVRRKWKEALTAWDQEKAIDDLVSTWETDCQGYSYRGEKIKGVRRPHDANLFRCLAPGSVSKSHRQTILFAASEYDRLVLLFPEDEEHKAARNRMAAKATALRHLARR